MNIFQICGVVVGATAGVTWELLATSRFGHFRTLIPSLFVKEGGSTWHIHHWILYAIVLLIITIISYKTERLSHPAVLFLGSAIIAAIIFNFIVFKDWNLFMVSRLK